MGKFRKNVVETRWQVIYRDKDTGEYYEKVLKGETEDAVMLQLPKTYEIIEIREIQKGDDR